MTPDSSHRRTAHARARAASIIQGIGPQKCERNSRRGLFFFSSTAFSPYSSRRLTASDSLSPFAGSLESSSTMSRPDFFFSSSGSIILGIVIPPP